MIFLIEAIILCLLFTAIVVPSVTKKSIGLDFRLSSRNTEMCQRDVNDSSEAQQASIDSGWGQKGCC